MYFLPFRFIPSFLTFPQMSGISMLPTLASSGELVIENILTYRLFPNDLKRGDLITLKSPLDPSRIICKRILGLPGDIVCVDPTGISAPSTEHVIVPKGHVWIIGDNAAYSRDSRTYGPVSMSLIRGKLYARVSRSVIVITTNAERRLDLAFEGFHGLPQPYHFH
jgi:inner membrane protease subunit 1